MAREDEVSKINVGNFTVGIVGLKAALEQASAEGIPPDETGAHELLQRLKRRNYIPSNSEVEYAGAFLREYRKFKGLPVQEHKPQELEVKILGPGCVNCEKLEQMVYRVMSAANILGSVEHVRDLSEIAAYGLVPTPALVINGKVKSSGRLPQERQILQWIKDASRA